MSGQTRLEEIAQRQKKWEEELKQAKCTPGKKFITVSGEPIKELYTPLDIQEIDFNRDIGFPGEYP